MGPTPLFDASKALLPLISKVFSETDRELVPKWNKFKDFSVKFLRNFCKNRDYFAKFLHFHATAKKMA